MNFKKAFKCKKCPESNGVNGCPMWWEYMQTNGLGQEKIEKSCGYQALPMFMIEVIKASNRPAEEIGSMRNEMLNAVNRLPNLIGMVND